MSKKSTSPKDFLSDRGRNLLIEALCDNKISKADLQNAWNSKKFSAEDMLYFTSTNKKYLDFLGITYRQEGMSLYLHPDKYVGCVPFVSPITGIKTGNLLVRGRFREDISELLSVVGEGVNIEYEPKYLLKQESTIKPPLYFICQQYLDKYIEAKKNHWQKFNNVEKIQSFPTSSTKWDKYAIKSADIRNLLRYPNRVNVLSDNHSEWQVLTYILDLCIQELLSVRTPVRSRTPYIDKINQLAHSYSKCDLKYANDIKTHMTDPRVIKDLKEIGRKIINASAGVSCAWRLDQSLFFERYVQYLLGEVAHTRGIKILNNTHFGIRGDIPAFGLKYIEPDVILEKDNIQYIVDAKYKMYMYAFNTKSELLYDDFRNDLHQILSYAAFGKNSSKKVIIAVPYDSQKDPIKRTFQIRNPHNGCLCDFHLVGIPLSKVKIHNTKALLSSILNFE